MSPLVRDSILVAEALCWPICFWWMHRISKRQNTVLEQLQRQTHRIEHVSKEEHEILKELHPAVQKIEEKVAPGADQNEQRDASRSGSGQTQPASQI